MSRTHVAAVALAAATLIAGCGGGGENKSSGGSSQTGSVEEQLGFSQASSPAVHARVENDIAACMKAEGFQYTPVDAEARQAALTGKSNLSDEDFTQQFGYGIATLFGRGTAQADPNARIRSSLTPAERRAYDRALTGGKTGQTYFRAADTGDFTEVGGCTKRATDKLFGGAQLLSTLQRKLDELDDAVQQDQRMVRAFEQWRRCMRDKTGQGFEDSEDVEIAIQKRLEDLVGPLPSGESAPGEFASLTPDQLVDAGALATLRRTEVQLANADLVCEEKHIDEVETVVSAEKERAFRDANAELLRKVKPLGG